MKAIIFNSGIGKRMGALTHNNHKSMVKLHNGETLFERQIRILSECGINHFVVTTGLYEENFKKITDKYKNIKVDYVNNPIYDKTNYIYSFYLARNYIDDDFLMLHGDLVFNKAIVNKIINSDFESCVTIDKTKPLPEKDFKGRLVDDKLAEVSISIFDKNCFALQPFYKLSKRDIIAWIKKVAEFIEEKHIDSVYAENAMNEISSELHIAYFDASSDFVEEIDNPEDYNNVTKAIKYYDYIEQGVCHSIDEIQAIIDQKGLKKPLIVLDSFLNGKIDLGLSDASWFSDFKPNPIYEDVVKAVNQFKKDGCDCLISIGGGSAIDTAKAIKMFLPLDENKCYLDQDTKYINLTHIAVPTTAGTGSESTRYSVIYFDGKKLSLTNDFLVPEYCVLDASFLNTLPYRQKSATAFDALCHSIESLWSVNCNKLSQEYAKESLNLILNNIKAYLSGDNSKNDVMMRAANLAGKAINITQTTAAHAMSYKLTSLFGLPHGQAVALCLEAILKDAEKLFSRAIHPLGKNYINGVFEYLQSIFEVSSTSELADKFGKMIDDFDLRVKLNCNSTNIEILANSVNVVRLRNFPVQLSNTDIFNLYNLLAKNCIKNN